MNNLRKLAIPAALAVLFFIMAGCCQKCKPADGKKILANIGNYEMTVEDFKNEAALISPYKYLPGDSAKVKEEFLDELITKKILLQEAQAQNFDKDKAFMKEIERYWEQALLKLLIKKKQKEFSADIVITEKDLKDEYGRMANKGVPVGPFERMAPEIRRDITRKREEEAFEKWMSDLRKKTKVNINRKELNDIKLE